MSAQGRPQVPAVRDDLRAEYEQLAALVLGHTRDDIRKRIRRAVLARLAVSCLTCGARSWEQCHIPRGKRASVAHAARRSAAVNLVAALPKVNWGEER